MMDTNARRSACIAAAAAMSMVLPARAIVIGTLDTFQDLTTQGWEGALPVNISTGGPAGAGDAFLELTSTGGFGPGSRLASDNAEPRWTGDYLAAGVSSLEADFVNFGTMPLEMRVVLFNGAGVRYTSRSAVVVPTDGLWHHLVFNLDAAALLSVLGTATYGQCLANVDNLMFRHNSGVASAGGTPIAAVAGIDNILAVPAPGAAVLLAIAGLGAGRRRRSSRLHPFLP